jgi:hypothetical protein
MDHFIQTPCQKQRIHCFQNAEILNDKADDACSQHWVRHRISLSQACKNTIIQNFCLQLRFPHMTRSLTHSYTYFATTEYEPDSVWKSSFTELPALQRARLQYRMTHGYLPLMFTAAIFRSHTLPHELPTVTQENGTLLAIRVLFSFC